MNSPAISLSRKDYLSLALIPDFDNGFWPTSMLLFGPFRAGFNHYGRGRLISALIFSLPFFQRALEAVGFDAGFQDVGLVCETNQNRFAQARIGKHLCPLRKRQVRRYDDCCLFSAARDDLKQQLRSDNNRHQ